MMKKMCSVHGIAWMLVIVGGLNWLLVGAFDYNLVEGLLGSWPWLVKAVYILVGASALMMLGGKKCCMGKCEHDAPSAPGSSMPKP